MSPARRTALTVIAALTAGALTAGCDTVDQQPTVTKEQAVERVAARAQEAFGQLPAGATLKQTLAQTDLPCENGPKGSTFVETDYAVEYPATWPVEQSMATLSAYWHSNKYKIVRDDRSDDKFPELVVEHPTDGFRIGYLVAHRNNGRIDAILKSSSPCL